MSKLFGTDGIRGVVGENLTADLAFRVGQAVGTVLMEERGGERPTVVLGKDTRISSDMLEAARLDGANRWQLLVYMQFPMLTLYIGVGAVFLVMQFFGIFREAYLLFETSFPPDEVYLLQHYMHNHFLRLNYPYLAAAAILFTAFLVVVIWVVRVLTTRFIKYRHGLRDEGKR